MSEIDNGPISTAVIVRPANLPTVQEMRNKLEERRAVRALLLTYLKEEMTEGQHFGTIPGTNTPMLYQDGARLVQTIFDVTSGKPELDEEYGEDGHYRCTATIPLVSLATGEILYYGMGTCSTHESKYAHRWVYESDVPIDIDKASLKSMTRDNKPPRQGTYTRYLLPNLDLGDLHHTILTMALKRADTRATMKLPSVGDIFMEPDAKDTEEEDAERSTVLEKLRAWFRTCPLEQRDSVASLVFRVRSQKSLSELATDMLAEGLAILETADFDWASPTLSSDYKAWQKAKGVRSGAELFGEDPVPVTYFVSEEKLHEGELETAFVKLYEDRPSVQPPIPPLPEDISAVKLAPNVPISPGASPAEWRPSVPPEAAPRFEDLLADRASASHAAVPLPEGKARKRKPTKDEQRREVHIMELVRNLAREAGTDFSVLLAAADAQAPTGFSRQHMSASQASEYVQWLRGEAMALMAEPASEPDDIAPPFLTLDTWLAETARDKGGTADDVLAWLREHDSDDLFGQAAGLDPFAELPECLDRLDTILKGMPRLSTVDVAPETQHTPA